MEKLQQYLEIIGLEKNFTRKELINQYTKQKKKLHTKIFFWNKKKLNKLEETLDYLNEYLDKKIIKEQIEKQKQEQSKENTKKQKRKQQKKEYKEKTKEEPKKEIKRESQREINYKEFYIMYDQFEQTFEKYKNLFTMQERKEYLTIALDYARKVGEDKSKIQDLQDLTLSLKKQGEMRKLNKQEQPSQEFKQKQPKQEAKKQKMTEEELKKQIDEEIERKNKEEDEKKAKIKEQQNKEYFIMCLNYFKRDIIVNEYTYAQTLKYYSFLRENYEKYREYQGVDKMLDSVYTKMHDKTYFNLTSAFALNDIILNNFANSNLKYEDKKVIEKHLNKNKPQLLKEQINQKINGKEFYEEIININTNEKKSNLINEVNSLQEIVNLQKDKIEKITKNNSSLNTIKHETLILDNKTNIIKQKNNKINKVDNYLYYYHLIDLVAQKHILNDLFVIQKDYIEKLSYYDNQNKELSSKILFSYLEPLYNELEKHKKNDQITNEYKKSKQK